MVRAKIAEIPSLWLVLSKGRNHMVYESNLKVVHQRRELHVTSGNSAEIPALARKLPCNQAISLPVVQKLKIALMEPSANNLALVTANRQLR